jgi:hypothetical protein
LAEPVDSFATVEEADAYNATQLFGASWADVDEDLKPLALATATRLLNDNLTFVIDTSDPDAIPEALKNATAEYARILVARGDPTAPSKTDGIKKFKAGPVDVEFDVDHPKTYINTVIPAYIVAMIAHLLYVAKVSVFEYIG